MKSVFTFISVIAIVFVMSACGEQKKSDEEKGPEQHGEQVCQCISKIAELIDADVEIEKIENQAQKCWDLWNDLDDMYEDLEENETFNAIIDKCEKEMDFIDWHWYAD